MNRRPNVLLVVLDSVRAGRTSFYRSDRNTTPTLDSFAKRATLYESAVAPGTGSTQSHTSIFTGYHVVQHRVNSGQKRLTAETIWDLLNDEGYATGLFSHNPYLTQVPTGLGRPFDHVVSGNPRNVPFPEGTDTGGIEGTGLGVYWAFLKEASRSEAPLRSLANGVAIQADNLSWLPYSLGAVDGREITDAFTRWHADRTAPWAACLNYMDAHTPFRPRPEYNEWATDKQVELARTLDSYVWPFLEGRRPLSELHSLRNVYDECIKQADAEVGRLLKTLDTRDDLRETLVVITADHGEGLGEEGAVRSVPSVGHGGTGGPEEGVLRVPLVVQYPEQTQADVVADPVSLASFPDVVRSVVIERDELGFVRGDQALSSSLGLAPAERAAKPDAVGNLSDYDEPARVVYELTDGRLLKHTLYGERAVSLDVTNPNRTQDVTSQYRPERVVRPAFDELSYVESVSDDRSSIIEEETKRHLEYLGYR